MKKSRLVILDYIAVALCLIGLVCGAWGVVRLAKETADVWSFVLLGVGLLSLALLTVGRGSAAYNTGMQYASWRANGRVVRPGADREATSYSTSVASDVGEPRVKGMQTTLEDG